MEKNPAFKNHFLNTFSKNILSPLAKNALEKLSNVKLDSLKQAGIWRNRGSYFLNISYPSMQVMEVLPPEQIHLLLTQKQKKHVALYIHIPFCIAECYYCHYYKKFNQSNDNVDVYLIAVAKEMELYKKKFGSIIAESIYIGGGTPSYLTPKQIDGLFAAIAQNITILPNTEISFEMHPESSNTERMMTLFNNGVNRLNIGVESFENSILKSENRRHTSQDAIDAYERAKATGFLNINLDLIYGLREQTLNLWEENLNQIEKLSPPSACMYYLRLKKGTPEYRLWKSYPGTFPSDEDLLLMHAMNFEKMEKELNYVQTPVDWFIRDNYLFHKYQSHNWREADEIELLGIGVSSYSYINGWQYYNVNDIDRYVKTIFADILPIWKGEYLKENEERMRRTLMLGLKMGIKRRAFSQSYKKDVIEAFPDIWEELVDLKLVEITPEEVFLTYSGKLFADEVGQKFYSQKMSRRMALIDPELVSTTWPQFNP
jgi:oxygen-independent coproporphyrinogen-3 oxidase